MGWAPPQQRTVLVLRDVVELRATEVAELLHTTPGAVRAAHRRARRALGDLPEEPPALDAAILDVAARLGQALAQGDLAGTMAVLAPEVELCSDGANGRCTAAFQPVFGADRVARLLLGVSAKGGPSEVTLVRRNDRLAFRVVRHDAPRRYARVVGAAGGAGAW